MEEFNNKTYFTLKEAAKLFGYSPDYLGFLIRKKKIKGKRTYNTRWQITKKELLTYCKERKKKIKKPHLFNKKLTLKQASRISGYSPDYIGQLLRTEKLKGKRIKTQVSWLVEKQNIENYRDGREERQSKTRKPLSLGFVKIRRKKLVLIGRRLVASTLVLIYFISGIAPTELLLASIGAFFIEEPKTINLYSQVAEGGWQNPQNSQGPPDLSFDKDITSFSESNSAVYQTGPLSLVLKDFDAQEDTSNYLFNSAQIKLSFAIGEKEIDISIIEEPPAPDGAGQAPEQENTTSTEEQTSFWNKIKQFFNSLFARVRSIVFKALSIAKAEEEPSDAEAMEGEAIVEENLPAEETPPAAGDEESPLDQDTWLDEIIEESSSAEATEDEASPPPEAMEGEAEEVEELEEVEEDIEEPEEESTEQESEEGELPAEETPAEEQVEEGEGVQEDEPTEEESAEEDLSSDESSEDLSEEEASAEEEPVEEVPEEQSFEEPQDEELPEDGPLATSTEEVEEEEPPEELPEEPSQEQPPETEPLPTDQTTTTETEATTTEQELPPVEETTPTTSSDDIIATSSDEVSEEVPSEPESEPEPQPEPDILPNIDAKIIIYWSLDGEDWQILDTISSYPLSNHLNNGYFTYNTPFLTDWQDITNLQIKFEGAVGGQTNVISYLDSVWVTAEYEEQVEEEPEETPAPDDEGQASPTEEEQSTDEGGGGGSGDEESPLDQDTWLDEIIEESPAPDDAGQAEEEEQPSEETEEEPQEESEETEETPAPDDEGQAEEPEETEEPQEETEEQPEEEELKEEKKEEEEEQPEEEPEEELEQEPEEELKTKKLKLKIKDKDLIFSFQKKDFTSNEEPFFIITTPDLTIEELLNTDKAEEISEGEEDEELPKVEPMATSTIATSTEEVATTTEEIEEEPEEIEEEEEEEVVEEPEEEEQPSDAEASDAEAMEGEAEEVVTTTTEPIIEQTTTTEATSTEEESFDETQDEQPPEETEEEPTEEELVTTTTESIIDQTTTTEATTTEEEPSDASSSAEATDDKGIMEGEAPPPPEATEGEEEELTLLEKIKIFFENIILALKQGIQKIVSIIIRIVRLQIPSVKAQTANNLKLTIIQPNGKESSLTPQITTTFLNGKEVFEIKLQKPKTGLQPGLYKLQIEIETPEAIFISEQEFTWGVLAINTNKSIFLHGEQAYLQMAALNEWGHTLCDANLELKIKHLQSGAQVRLSTLHNTIKKSGECGPNNVVDVPDYYAYYQVKEPGKYEMTLKNLDTGYEITDSFEAQNSISFDVERIGPTRIWPWAPYQMTLKIKANQGFEGQIIEKVPQGFDILNIEADQVRINTQNNADISVNPRVDQRQSASSTNEAEKLIIWDVSLTQGDLLEISYKFDAPDISPYLFLLGPLEFIGDSIQNIENREEQELPKVEPMATSTLATTTVLLEVGPLATTTNATGSEALEAPSDQNGTTTTTDELWRFNLHSLESFTFTFQESRKWQLASDAASLTQHSYIFENDDHSWNPASNTDMAAINTTTTDVKKGQRFIARFQIDNTADPSTTTFKLQYDKQDEQWIDVDFGGAPNINKYASSSDWNATTVDSVGNIDEYCSSLAIGTDGNPVISYYDFTNFNLNFLKCGNPSCTSGNTTTTVDEGFAGEFNSIAIDADGYPMISYSGSGGLDFAKCTNTDCTQKSDWATTTISGLGYGSRTTSIAIGIDNKPMISYGYCTYFDEYCEDLDLLFARCTSGDCTDKNHWSTTTVDETPNVGYWSSIAIGTDGNPVISYYDTSNYNLNFAKCTTTDCTQKSDWATTTVDEYSGGDNSIAIGSDGLPVIAYDNGNKGVNFAKCTTTDCTNDTDWSTTTISAEGNNVYYISIAIGTDGNPLISYKDRDNGILKIAKCKDAACSGATSSQVLITINDVVPVSMYEFISLAIGWDGWPVISYFGGDNGDLKVAKMRPLVEIQPAWGLSGTSSTPLTSNEAGDCAGGASWTDGEWYEATTTSRAIFLDTDKCTELAFVLDTAEATASTTYRLRLVKEDGTPLDVYTELPALKIVKETQNTLRYSKEAIKTSASTCLSSNWDCNIASSVGTNRSIAIGTDGNPVISYHDPDGQNIVLLKCGNPLCTSGNTTTTISSGSFSSVAIGLDGNPVIAYNDIPTYDLEVAKCDNSSCSSFSTTTVDSGNNAEAISIAIGTDGNPVISYFDETDDDLLFVKCGNPSCTAGNIPTTLDSTDESGRFNSLAIGADGYPVISYSYDSGGIADNARVYHCSSTDCSTGDDTSINFNIDSQFISMAIGIDGYPIIVYNDNTNDELDVYHCTSLDCQNGETFNIVSKGGENNAIAIGSNGNPIIPLRNDFTNSFNILTCTSVNCSGKSQVVLGASAVSPSIAIGKDGRPIVSYSLGSVLKVAKQLGLPKTAISYFNRYIKTDGQIKLTRNQWTSATTGAMWLEASPAIEDGLQYKFDKADYIASQTSGDSSFSNVTSTGGTSTSTPVFVFTDKFSDNTQPLYAKWQGQSTLQASSKSIVLQIFRFGNSSNTTGWMTITEESSCSANADCSIVGSTTTDLTDFYYPEYKFNDSTGTTSPDYWVFWRVYQEEATGVLSPPTLKTDFWVSQNEALGIHQRAYVFENDDGNTVNENSDMSATNTTTTDLKKGQRFTARFQIDNDGSAATNTYKLQYDKQDSQWIDIDYGGAPNINSGASSSDWNAVTVDSSGQVGYYSSITIGFDGNPVIAHHHDNNQDLMVTKCGNPSCTSGNITTAVDSGGNVGPFTSIAIGTDGNPVISYQDDGNNRLNFAKCGNPSCTLGNSTTSIDLTPTAAFSSIAINTSGRPIIAYYAVDSDLNFARCTTGNCTQKSDWATTTVDEVGDVGRTNSIAIGTDGYPVIAYYDNTNDNLSFARCTTGNCTQKSDWATTTVDEVGDVGNRTSLAIGTDGNPVISYFDTTNDTLNIAKCGNPFCTSGNTTTSLSYTDDIGGWTSIGIGTDGNPIIAHTYAQGSPGLLGVLKCGNLSCSSGNTTTTVEELNNLGASGSMAIGTDGWPVISYLDDSNDDLKVAKMRPLVEIQPAWGLSGDSGEALNATQAGSCLAGTSWTNGKWFEATTTGTIGLGANKCTELAFALDTSEATASTTYRLRLVKEDGTTLDSYVEYPTLQIVPETENTLRYSKEAIKTSASSCGGTTEYSCSEVFYDNNHVAYDTSIAIGTDGYPVIVHSLWDADHYNLLVTHCSSLDCSSISTTTEISYVNKSLISSSIAIGTDGYPVIAYQDFNSSPKTLLITKCSSLDCTSISTTTELTYDNEDVAYDTSIAIGTDGLPVIAYDNGGASPRTLLITKCASTDCTSISSTTEVTYDSDSVGGDPSLAIGTDGYPVIAHRNISGSPQTLMITKCASADCSSISTTTEVTYDNEDAGRTPSLAIGTDGYPVIAHSKTSALLITNCSSADCTSISTTTEITYDNEEIAFYISLAIGTDGLPVIAYQNITPDPNTLLITKCAFADCSSISTTTEVSYDNEDTGYNISLAIGTDGNPVIAHQNFESSPRTLLITKQLGLPKTAISYFNRYIKTDGQIKISRNMLSGLMSEGPNNPDPASVEDDDSYGTHAWSTPERATNTDDHYAVLTSIPSSASSHYLKATNFVFSIPDGAIIQGIKVDVERSQVAIIPTGTKDDRVRIVKGGEIGSTERKKADQWPTTDTYQTYGSATDLWGEIWTPSNINASNFGFAISAYNSSDDNDSAYVDHIRITIYYKIPALYLEASPAIEDGLQYKFDKADYTSSQTSGDSSFTNVTSTGGASTSTPMFVFTDKHSTNTVGLYAKWQGQSTLGADQKSIVLQVFRFGNSSNTTGWVTTTVNTTCQANTDCTLEYSTTTNLEDFFYPEYKFNDSTGTTSPDYWTFWRVYQKEVTGSLSPPTLKTDFWQTESETQITQRAYIFENDDGNTVNENSNMSATNTTTTDLKKGQRFVARFQIDNTGISATNTFKLQYDKQDNQWIDIDYGGAPNINTGASSSDWNVTTVDSVGNVGMHTSIAIGTDGNPVVSYYDTTNDNLNFLKCGNPSCTSGNTTTTVDEVGSIGAYTSIAIGTDGLPVISYFDDSNDNLNVAKCTSEDCTQKSDWSTSTVHSSSTATVGQYTSIAIGTDGNPVISYYNNTNDDLMFAKCGNPSCSSGNSTGTVDSTGDVGQYTSITIGADGLPVISYYDVTNYGLKILKCGNSSCDSGNTITLIKSGQTGDGACDSGYAQCGTIGESFCTKCGCVWSDPLCQIPIEGHECDQHATQSLCEECDGCTWNDTDGYTVGKYSSIAIGIDGNPVVAYTYSYNDNINVDLNFLKCGNSACSSGNTTTTVDSTGDVGEHTSITIGTDGLPMIAYQASSTKALKIAKCRDAYCSNASTTAPFSNITRVIDDSGGVTNFGVYTSITIGWDGWPVISYYDDDNDDLKVAKMRPLVELQPAWGLSGSSGDTLNATQAGSCVAGTSWTNGKWSEASTTATIGIGANECTELAFALDTSEATASTTYRLRLVKENGTILDAYSEYPTLKIVKESENTLRYSKEAVLTSASNGSSTDYYVSTVDSPGNVGLDISIAIGTDGNPVIAYSGGDQDLIVLKCGNPSCTSGNTTTTVDQVGDVGVGTSIAIGTDGNPVISYYDATLENLNVAKCGNPSCTSGNTTTTVDWTGDVGQDTSIAIGTDGNPVIAYINNDTVDLLFAKCGNPSCTSGNTTTTVDEVDAVGQNPSIAIGTDGFPVISHYDGSNSSVNFAKCTGGNCTQKSDWSTTTVDNADGVASIAIGTDGYPVISYFSNELRFAKCTTTDCTQKTDWSTTTIDSTVFMQDATSMAIGTDGNPVIAYGDYDNSTLKIAKCGNSSCTSGNTTTSVGSTNGGVTITSIAVGSDGYPVVAYSFLITPNYDLKLAKQLGLPKTAISYFNNYIKTDKQIKLTRNQWTIATTGAMFLEASPAIEDGLLYKFDKADYTASQTSGDSSFSNVTSTGGASTSTPVFVFTDKHSTNTVGLYAKWQGQSTLGADQKSIVLQIFRFGNSSNTTGWVTTTENTTCSANTDCTLEYSTTTDLEDFFYPEYKFNDSTGTTSPDYWTFWRVYQKEVTGSLSPPTLKTDFWQTESESTLTQRAYIFENDDGSTVNNNSNMSAANTTTTDLKKGQRFIARFQIDNTGVAATNTFKLQYDKQDNQWIDIDYGGAPNINSGASSSDWNAVTVDSLGDLETLTGDTSIAIGTDGNPVISYYASTTDFNTSTLNVLKCGNPSCTYGNTATTVDSTGGVGLYSSIAIGNDGNPVISYYDYNNGNLKIVKCGNPSCTSNNTITTVHASTTGDVGYYTSIAIGTDGNPVIAYYDANPDTFGILMVAKCGNPSCTSGNTTNTIDTAWAGYDTSIAVPPDGNPVISYGASAPIKLKVVKCGDSFCSSGNTITTLDSDSDVFDTSLAIPADGNPVIAYYDAWEGNRLKVAKCGNPSCTSGNTTTTVASTTDNLGDFVSIAIGTDGLPVISYQDSTNKALKITKCRDAYCSSASTTAPFSNISITIDDSGSAAYFGAYTSMAIGWDGWPVISYFDDDNDDLKVAKMRPLVEIQPAWGLSGSSGDALNATQAGSCVAGTSWTNGKWYEATTTSSLIGLGTYECTELAFILDTAEAIASTTYRLRLVKEDGTALDSYSEYPALILLPEATSTQRYSKEAIMTSASNGSSTDYYVSTVDSPGNVVLGISIAIGTDGNPVTAYSGGTQDLIVLKCGNPSCTSGNTITTVDQVGDVGSGTSIAIGTDGYPVISYYDATLDNLNVAKCGNPSCTSGNTTTTVDWTGDVGQSSSIAIGTDGNPVIAYINNDTVDLLFAKCGNPSCTSGNTTTTVDEVGMVGQNPSITIGTDGFPVISHYDGSNSTLNFAKCTGGNCTQKSDWSTTTVDNADGVASIAIGTDGYPVISYYGLGVSFAKCTTTDCTQKSDWATTTVDSTVFTQDATSIAIGTDGNPVIAYGDYDNSTLKIAKCGNPSCTFGNTTTSVGSTNSGFTINSIAVGSDGYPVAAYSFLIGGNYDLKVAKQLGLPKTAISYFNNYIKTDRQIKLTRNQWTSATTGAMWLEASPAIEDGLQYKFDKADYTSSQTSGDSSFTNVTSTGGTSTSTPVFVFADRHTTNTTNIYTQWLGQSTLGADSKNIVLQVFRFGNSSNTTGWVTTTEESSCTANTDCTIEGSTTTDLTDFYFPEYRFNDSTGTTTAYYWTFWRIYQKEATGAETTPTLKTDFWGISDESFAVGFIKQYHIRWRNDDGAE